MITIKYSDGEWIANFETEHNTHEEWDKSLEVVLSKINRYAEEITAEAKRNS